MAAIDFSNAIDNLEIRAYHARRHVRTIGAILSVTIMVVFILITVRILGIGDQHTTQIKTEDFSPVKLERGLQQRGLDLIESLKKQGTETPAAQTERAALKETVELLNTLSKHSSAENTSTSFGTNWATIAFSIGAVAFVVLLIQITVHFMRYYASLAELYSSQANALRASNGDAEVAIKFIQHFSSASVDIGSGPTTLYEKALETIKSVAEKNK